MRVFLVLLEMRYFDWIESLWMFDIASSYVALVHHLILNFVPNQNFPVLLSLVDAHPEER